MSSRLLFSLPYLTAYRTFYLWYSALIINVSKSPEIYDLIQSSLSSILNSYPEDIVKHLSESNLNISDEPNKYFAII